MERDWWREDENAGVHRQRRPLPGMLLHIDGSGQDER